MDNLLARVLILVSVSVIGFITASVWYPWLPKWVKYNRLWRITFHLAWPYLAIVFAIVHVIGLICRAVRDVWRTPK